MEMRLGLRGGRARLGAAGAAALAGLLAFILFWDAPQRAGLASRRRALEGTRIELARARHAADRVPALAAEVEDLRGRLARLSDRLPARRDASALLRTLEVAAVRSGLTIRAFAPQAPVERSWLAEWPIHLELAGTYHRLGLFFDRISGLDRIINLRDVAIEALDPARPDETITARCTATTYVLHEASPGAEPAGDRVRAVAR